MTQGLDSEQALSIAVFEDMGNSGAAYVASSLAAEIMTGFGPRDEAPLSVLANAGDTVVGGLNGVSHWGWFYIRHLWVHEDWRRRGFGHRLLAETQKQARMRQCVGLYVDTFDAGAASFYEQAGFQTFGRIDGFPPGHTRMLRSIHVTM